MIRTALLATLIGSCSGTAPPVGGTGEWTGYERQRFGTGISIKDLNCDLHWSVTGTPSSQSCRDCTYTYLVTRTYDEGASFNDGSCAEGANEDVVYGYVDDGTQAWLGRVEGDDLEPFAQASAETEGTVTRIVYTTGNLGYDAYSYYYVDYFEGYGRIEVTEDGDSGGTR